MGRRDVPQLETAGSVRVVGVGRPLGRDETLLRGAAGEAVALAPEAARFARCRADTTLIHTCQVSVIHTMSPSF